MDCNDVRDLVHGYVDGELDLVRNVEFERHVASCPACERESRSQQSLRAAFRSASLRHAMPPGLEERVRAALLRERRAAPGRFAIDRTRFGVAAAVLAAALLGFAARPLVSPGGAARDLAREVVSNHVRSLLANHLTDVLSSDRHTVKPWFAGKLDFAPPVVDVADRGFTLEGGRLDVVGGRPVAAFVYGRRQHRVNLFVWPSGAATVSATRSESIDGFSVARWVRGGMEHWAVSDINGTELDEFARAIEAAEAGKP